MIPEDENDKLPPGNWALDKVAGMLSDLNADSSDEEDNTPTPLPSLIEKILGHSAVEDLEFDKPNNEENVSGLTIDDLFPYTIGDANNNADSIPRFLEVDRKKFLKSSLIMGLSSNRVKKVVL